MRVENTVLNINLSQQPVQFLQERNGKRQPAPIASLPLLLLPLSEVLGDDGGQHVGAGAEVHLGVAQRSDLLQCRDTSLDFNVVDAQL